MQKILNDLIIYRSNVQTIHWKMKGQGFLAIHKLTDKMYVQINEFIDLIVEKYVQKNLAVKTTLKNAIENSTINETEVETISVSKGIEILVEEASAILAQAEQVNLDDKLGAMYVIVDELRDYLEKTIWLLEKSK